MKYEDFLTQLEDCIRSREGEEVKIHISHILKNNGKHTDSISVMSHGENISPAIGLEPYYHQAAGGMPMEQVTDQILACIFKCREKGVPSLGNFTDFEKAKEKIVCRVVHFQKNRELLETVPYTRFLDLAVIYYYLLNECDFPNASILVHKSHLEMWNITVEALHAQAAANTPVLLPYEFGSMMSVLKSMTGMPYLLEEEDEKCRMYVLSNRQKMFGAVNMIYTDILEKIAETLGEDYFVLPGSVHECIIVPVSMKIEADELQKIVKEINQTQVEPEEFLSDSVYRYCRGSKNLMIAAEDAKN